MSSINSIPRTEPVNNIDYQLIFDSIPGLYLILSPTMDLRIMAVNDAYLNATMTKREDIMNKGILEVFSDNPDEKNSSNIRNLKASLITVLETKKLHKMNVQKYDIRRPYLNLETAVEDDKVMQGFEPESLLMEGDHSQKVKAPPIKSDYGSKDCVNLSSPTVVSRLKGEDFEERYWNLTNSPAFNKEQEMIAIIHRMEDVTEFIRTKQQNEAMQEEMIKSKLIEEARLGAIKEAETQQRIRAEEAITYNRKLEGFINMVCHEIRNPLNGVIASTYLLNSYLSDMQLSINDLNEVLKKISMGKLADAMRESIKAIQICSTSEKIIVDDLLDLSKLDAKKLLLNNVVFNLKEIISTCVSMHDASMKNKNINKILKFPSENVFVKSDPFRLSQVINNLVSNAVKFTAKKGSIEISVDCNKLETSSKITISVKDSGIGMTIEEQQHLFDKFYQANHKIASEYGGSGLGLLIAKELVELMRGDIKVESQKNVGTTVTFSIVCDNVNEEFPESKVPPFFEVSPDLKLTDLPNPSQINILIVEDNKVNQDVLIKILERKGYKCSIANNGQEALDWYDKKHFDLIFMDFEMPIMGGLDATSKIRQREELNHIKKCIPIVGLSANPKTLSTQEGLVHGMNDFICKPYFIKDIYESITKWIPAEEKIISIENGDQKELKKESDSV